MELLEIHFVCLGLAVLYVILCVSANKYGLRAFYSFHPRQVTIYMLLNAFRCCETGATVCTV
jgi:hypothetical protein